MILAVGDNPEMALGLRGWGWNDRWITECFLIMPHLLDERFDDDREAGSCTAPGHGVGNVVEASSDLENSIHAAAALAPGTSPLHAAAVGLHPHNAKREWDGRTEDETADSAART